MELTRWLTDFSSLNFIMSISLIVVVILVINFEIFYRLRYDSVINLVKSIQQTIALRKFLHQYQSTEILPLVELNSPQLQNPINKKFNKAVRRCFVDIQNDFVIVTLAIPRSQQAQQIFRNIESHIREELASNNPDYYFSGATRKGNQLILIGNKR
ncbi:TPA: hypothetical protein ACGO35_000328 [Streptococcus suis]